MDDHATIRTRVIFDFHTGAGVDYGAQIIAAAAAGDVRAVEDLLDDGAIHANAQDYDGRRPLHLAAGEEHLEVVTLLLSRGADLCVNQPVRRVRWRGRPGSVER